MGSEAAAEERTVGVVLVSHSRALAAAALEMARQMAGTGAVRIETAAGVSGPDGADLLGTDASAIAEAMQRADDGAGVVVLTDLGSALLSAGLALDLLPDGLRDRVVVSPGPFVEGLMIAAIAAGTGAPLASVAEQAGAALLMKQSGA